MRATALFVMSFAALLAGTRPGGAQDTPPNSGIVTGQVRDQVSGEPLVGARVTVVGMLRPSVTNEEGRYTVAGVPAGAREVRVTYIGYAPASQSTTVQARGTATVDFTLERSAIELSAIITTATGVEQSTRELGNAVSNINVADVDLAPVRNFSDLVQGRAAGVAVLQSSGTTGSGARIRIRGSNSVSLSNSPLVLVDGIRVDDDPESYELFTGGQTTSRLNDINPESIESIEILKGPAAAALYGTAAANGVIQITTKRGRAGAARWSLWSEFSSFDRTITMPDNVLHVDDAGDPCDFIARVEDGCTVAEVLTFNPLENPATTPFRAAGGQRYGASVGGGSGTSTYFLSAEMHNERGVLEENDLRRVNLRANLSGQFRENVELSASAGYVDSDIQLPQNDNSGIGILVNGLTGSPESFFVDNWQGYAIPRSYLFVWDQNQDITRSTISGQATWRPYTWLAVNGTAGVDNVNQHDNDLLAPNVAVLFGPPLSTGLRESLRSVTLNYTANLGGTATWMPGPDVVLTSSTGVQYYRDRIHQVFASGTGVTPGTGSLGGVTADFQVAEGTEETITLGTYFQQQLAWRDRLFLTGAVRGDRNSAFGTDLGWIWYPAVSASWVVSEEEFFPTLDALSELRLRTAWGRSGLRPNFRDAQRFFSAVTAVRNIDSDEIPGFVIDPEGAGNPALRPEISTELELGVTAGLLDDRLGLELTYYTKDSKDALISVPLPPSTGGALERFDNIGRVSNHGWEFAVHTVPLDRTNATWRLSMNGFTNTNELESLGGQQAIVFGLLGDTQRHEEGYPLGGYWQRDVTFEDEDANGTITPGEVTIGEYRFLGSPFPTRELSFRSELTLWNRVRLSGLLDHKGGHKMFNATKWIRCTQSGLVCAERFANPGSLEEQAAMVAAVAAPFTSVARYIEDADFWRLREIALTFMVPERYVRRLGAQAVDLTLAGRNLATWSDYTGFDPEVNSDAQSNFNSSDNTALPPLRTWVLRFDVAF